MIKLTYLYKLFLLFLISFGIQEWAVAQNRPESLINKGNEFYKLKEYDKAGALYEQALKGKNKLPYAEHNYGNVFYRQQQLEEAINHYDEAARLAKDPKDKADAIYNKGVALTHLKQLQEAIDAYKQSLKYNPQHEQARINLQKALQEKKQQDQQNQDNKDQQKQQQDEQKEQEQEKSGDQKQQKNKLNKEQVEQLLKALEQKEKDIQQRMQNNKSANPVKPEKDW
ncbi:MAG TPA: tetratricopeptide repeat protein [Parasegetibacter sp.]|jgi:Ca-activated chloride channel family protein